MDASNRYKQKYYERQSLLFRKGDRAKVAEAAKAEGKTMNRYILEAIEAKSGLKLTLDNVLPWMNKE